MPCSGQMRRLFVTQMKIQLDYGGCDFSRRNSSDLLGDWLHARIKSNRVCQTPGTRSSSTHRQDMHIHTSMQHDHASWWAARKWPSPNNPVQFVTVCQASQESRDRHQKHVQPHSWTRFRKGWSSIPLFQLVFPRQDAPS